MAHARECRYGRIKGHDNNLVNVKPRQPYSKPVVSARLNLAKRS